MAKIVIEFDSLQDAEDSIDDVRQLFMRRNPLDEPMIELIVDDSDTDKDPPTKEESDGQ